jgi:hypothetical protein
MREAGFVPELVQGLSGAIVIPLALAVTWGRFWKAGVIVGIGLAVLLHVTIALVAITIAYQAVEWVTQRLPIVALSAAVVIVASAVITFALSLA